VVDTDVRGRGVRITSVEVFGFGENRGAVVNWDWEVHVGPTPFGFPEGQFIQTHIDPVAGYQRNAPTQFRFVIGSRADGQSYVFRGHYDFTTGMVSAAPYLGRLSAAFTSERDYLDGLHAQVFFWTADNRNCNILFDDVTLIIRGTIEERLEIEVPVDIRPRSCPNPLNPNSRGTLPVAVVGSPDLDVETIDPASVRLAGVPPIRHALEDVTTPFEPFVGKRLPEECHEACPDGVLDLTLKFRTQDVLVAIGVVAPGDVLVLEVRGNLREEFGGTPLVGEDVVVVVGRGNARGARRPVRRGRWAAARNERGWGRLPPLPHPLLPPHNLFPTHIQLFLPQIEPDHLDPHFPDPDRPLLLPSFLTGYTSTAQSVSMRVAYATTCSMSETAGFSPRLYLVSRTARVRPVAMSLEDEVDVEAEAALAVEVGPVLAMQAEAGVSRRSALSPRAQLAARPRLWLGTGEAMMASTASHSDKCFPEKSVV
jgi:hypothetical protein